MNIIAVIFLSVVVFLSSASYVRLFSVTKNLFSGICVIIFCLFCFEIFAGTFYESVLSCCDLGLINFDDSAKEDNSVAADLDVDIFSNIDIDIVKQPDQNVLSPDIYLAQAWRGGGCLWSNLYYSNTELKPKDVGIKIKPDNFGIQIGLDVLTDHEVYSTFLINANESKTQYGNLLKSKIDNFIFGYGKVYHWQVAHFGWGVNIGYDQYRITAAGKKFSGNGLQSRFDGEFGLSFIFRKWEVKPFYAIQYNFLYHGEIDSANDYVLQGDWNGHGLTQFIGIRLNWKPIDGVLLFQSRATWVHEMLNNPPPFYSSHFSSIKGKGASTPSVFFFDGNIGRDYAWLGVGLKWSFLYQRSLFVDYDVAINDRRATHLINLGLCLGW
ncbi:MAG: autotransporter outer membrane beta-barrel domain-containing protein [Planctomycetaceae bacterium]|nr:autotransporter outer membrane beta-barrel domain-containing protein [Planctomycetaceae bacterium]